MQKEAPFFERNGQQKSNAPFPLFENEKLGSYHSLAAKFRFLELEDVISLVE